MRPITLSEFLAVRHFRANPFDTATAEQETDRLPSFFVRAPWFDQLVGDTQRPESLVLFAPRGFGKTSHRLEVARIAASRHDAPALVVTFVEFDLLLNQRGISGLTERYLTIIRRKVLEELAQQIRTDRRHLEKLQQLGDVFARFSALTALYAAPAGLVAPPQPVEEWMHYYQQQELGFREWLQNLTTLTTSAGFASIYLLFDGIDEWAETSELGSQHAVQLLKPLLNAPSILQEHGLAFKFFLPNDLEEVLHAHSIGRFDRIPVYWLKWNEDDLMKILAQRLVSYSLASTNNAQSQVQCFADLCDATFNVDLELVHAANESPRQLIRLARRVIEEHCLITDDAEMPISSETIQRVLADQPHQPIIAALATTAGARVTPIIPSIPTLTQVNAPPTLYFDPHGDIWIGEQRLEAKLPHKVYRCMEYLWQHRDRAVTYNELLSALYGDDQHDRGDPRSSLDKIVRRLRSLMEPGQPGSHTYIDVQPGIGYVLRNIRVS